MGDLVGGVIDGIGSIFGSNQAAKKADEGATTALTGYNYLQPNPLINQTQTFAGQSQIAQRGTNAQIAQLLGAQPITADTQNGFNNYLNSTGYQFQKTQGTNTVVGSAAAKGILNSGATAKALDTFGTGLASNYFNTYLGQLNGLSGLYNTQSNAGLNAAEAVGQAGTQGGGTAGQLQASAGQSAGTGTAQAFNYLGGGVQNTFGGSNPFGSIGGGGGNGAGAASIFNGLVP